VRPRPDGGFTLVEVLVALVVVAIGLAALMVAVSGTARTSGYLREKTLAQWIALNRLAEVRLTVNKVAQSGGIQSSRTQGSTTQSSSTQGGDTGELQFASRTWHYDTRYFDTTFQSTKRIVIRVWAGDAKTKGNPLAEATGFFGTGLSVPGNSNATDWTVGSTAASAASANCQAAGTPAAGINTLGAGTLNNAASGAANCNSNGVVNSNGVITAPGSTPTLPSTTP
jgi:general secretion pathway protein I